MPTYNTLTWQNENSLSNYPLNEAIEFRDFLIDAKFAQFDNFIPILNTVSVGEEDVSLVITFDYGVSSSIVLTEQKYLQMINNANVRIYTPTGDRFVGVISFGSGTLELFKTHKGRTLTLNVPFAADTVRSIPFQDAVYTFDGLYGDLLLGRGADDDSIFYNISTVEKSIMFNAVKYHEIKNANNKQGLRKINLVPPLDNNINLSPSDVVRVSPSSATSLKISLVSGTVSDAFSISKL